MEPYNQRLLCLSTGLKVLVYEALSCYLDKRLLRLPTAYEALSFSVFTGVSGLKVLVYVALSCCV